MSSQSQAPALMPLVVAFCVSVALYLAALAAPTFLFQVSVPDNSGTCIAPCPRIDVGMTTHYGFDVLFLSLFGPFYGNYAGFANPLLVIGWTLLWCRRPRLAFICLLASALLTLQTFQVFGMKFPLDEGVVKTGDLLELKIGFYLWIASILLALFYAGYRCLRGQFFSS